MSCSETCGTWLGRGNRGDCGAVTSSVITPLEGKHMTGTLIEHHQSVLCRTSPCRVTGRPGRTSVSLCSPDVRGLSLLGRRLKPLFALPKPSRPNQNSSRALTEGLEGPRSTTSAGRRQDQVLPPHLWASDSPSTWINEMTSCQLHDLKPVRPSKASMTVGQTSMS